MNDDRNCGDYLLFNRAGRLLRRGLFIVLLIWAATLLMRDEVVAQDWNRAYKNYQAIITKQKTFEQLTAEEQQEVWLLHQALSAARAPNDASDECRYAWDAANSAANDLEHTANRLARCAESRDFSDDCYSEFRRAKNAHSDYESAVSEVQSYCN